MVTNKTQKVEPRVNQKVKKLEYWENSDLQHNLKANLKLVTTHVSEVDKIRCSYPIKTKSCKKFRQLIGCKVSWRLINPDLEVSYVARYKDSIVTPMDEGWGPFTNFTDKGEELKDELEVNVFETMSCKTRTKLLDFAGVCSFCTCVNHKRVCSFCV